MDKIKKYILDKTSGGVSQDEIVWQVCQRSGLDWDEAQKFVLQTLGENVVEVYQRRLPVLVSICIVTQVGGLALVGMALWPVVDFWLAWQMHAPQSQRLLSAGLLASSASGLFGEVAFGVALLVAGTLGLWRVLRME